MKKLLLITMLIFSTNNSLAYSYLTCEVDGDLPYAGSPTAASKLYQLLNMVSDHNGYFQLYGEYKSLAMPDFYMDRVFVTKKRARNFCLAMKEECLKQFPDSKGNFQAYDYDATWSLRVNVTYLDPNQKTVTSSSCSNLIYPTER